MKKVWKKYEQFEEEIKENVKVEYDEVTRKNDKKIAKIR